MPKDRLAKGYAATRHGQVHYRVAGDLGAAPLILIHWTPLSGRMFAAHLPILAEAGYRAYAVDLLGYGRSDPRPDDWSIPAWGANILEAAGSLGITQASVYGGHMGASVAAEVALADPAFTRALILDGCPLPAPELRAAFAAIGAAPRPRASDDGAHERLAWRQTVGMLGHYLPGFSAEGEGIEAVWPTMLDYLETDFVSSAPLQGDYDLAERLPLLTVPVLVTAAETDSLVESYAGAARLTPGAERHLYAGDHPVHRDGDAQRFLLPLLPFLARHRG